MYSTRSNISVEVSPNRLTKMGEEFMNKMSFTGENAYEISTVNNREQVSQVEEDDIEKKHEGNKTVIRNLCIMVMVLLLYYCLT